ncbi:hypothetical protein [Rubritalea sp.]|uniref:hypothetical protein n=1 Tax=Rubritalea sp. TaxID=2109375 RepID=UPI003EFAE3E0
MKEKTKNTGCQQRIFTLDAVRLLMDNANEEWRSMICFGFYTGQPMGDLATLRW